MYMAYSIVSMRYFRVWLLFYCAVWQKSKVRFPIWVLNNSKSETVRHTGWIQQNCPHVTEQCFCSMGFLHGNVWVRMKNIICLIQDRHIYQEFLSRLRILLPYVPSSHGAHNCSHLWQIIKNPRELSKPPLLLRTPNQSHPPAVLTSLNRHLTSYLIAGESARQTGCHFWKQSSSQPFGLVSCPPGTSVYRRDSRNFFLLPLSISFVLGNFSSLLAVALGQIKMEQPEISFSRARDEHAHVSCKVFSEDINKGAVHWDRQQIRDRISNICLNKASLWSLKWEEQQASTSTLTINVLRKQDEAICYCAYWIGTHSIRVANKSCSKTTFRCGTPTFHSIWATTETAQLGVQPEVLPLQYFLGFTGRHWRSCHTVSSMGYQQLWYKLK